MSNGNVARKAHHSAAAVPFDDEDVYAATAALLGLNLSPDRLLTAIDVHNLLLAGLPGSALVTLLGDLRTLNRTGERLEQALGISLRTIQRARSDKCEAADR